MNTSQESINGSVGTHPLLGTSQHFYLLGPGEFVFSSVLKKKALSEVLDVSMISHLHSSPSFIYSVLELPVSGWLTVHFHAPEFSSS